jgi:hypothetical protein
MIRDHDAYEILLGPGTVVQFRSKPEPIPDTAARLTLSPERSLVVRIDTVDATGLASDELLRIERPPPDCAERARERAEASQRELRREAQRLLRSSGPNAHEVLGLSRRAR